VDLDLQLEVKKLIGERDIREQLFRYQEAINRGDLAELERFFGDATIATVSASNPDELHGVLKGGKQFAAGFANSVRFYDGIPLVQYSASNIIVQFNEAVDTATCHAYFFIFQALGDHDYTGMKQQREFPLQVIGCGRYLDTYKNTSGSWRIVEREIYSDMSGDYSKHMARSPASMAEAKGYIAQAEGSSLVPKVQSGAVAALRAPR
jgi:hypothetical protein